MVAPPAGPPPKILVREWILQNNHWILRYLGKEGNLLEFIFDQGGKSIRIRQSYPAWQNTMFLLLNPAMAASLHLQKIPVLHASSLVRAGVSFLLAGVSNAGKSSLAAALLAEGLAFHSDDMAAFSLKDGRPVIQAGYPRLKITPLVADALGWKTSDLLNIFFREPEYEEKWVDMSRIGKGFFDRPAPLGAIFVLSGRSRELNVPQIDILPAGQAALTLARHLYGYPWLQKPDASTIMLCARIANSTTVFGLRLPEGLQSLRSSARFLIREIDEIMGRSTCSGNRVAMI